MDHPEKLTLLVCHVDDGGAKAHACRKAHEALTAAGHGHDKVVHDQGKPLGLFTKGKRPDLKKISGQEKLPVLALPGGGAIAGGKNIVEWAKQNAPERSGGATT